LAKAAPAKSFPAEFRRRVLALVEAGRPVREVVADLEIAPATFYRWRTQALIDAGARPWTGSVSER
jgi:transposase